MISSSFLMLHINRSTTVPAHRPHLSLIPGISHSESMYSLRCSPIIQKQYKLAKRWDIRYSDRERGDCSLSCTTAKGIINWSVLSTLPPNVLLIISMSILGSGGTVHVYLHPISTTAFNRDGSILAYAVLCIIHQKVGVARDA